MVPASGHTWTGLSWPSLQQAWRCALTDPQTQHVLRSWVQEFQPALQLALEEFLTTAKWPERERFRRTLVQRDLDHLRLDRLIQEMPRSPRESRQFPPDRIVPSLQVFLEMDEAQALLAVCVVIIQRAYALYRSGVDEPTLNSDDPLLVEAAGGDAQLLLCAREVLEQHPPSPLGGGTSGTDSTHWTRWLNEAVVADFKGVASIEDYFATQEQIMSNDPYRVIARWRPELPVNSLGGADTSVVARTDTKVASEKIELFVIMPFGESWSAGTYAFIRRVVEKLEPPPGEIRLYRADEIAQPGQISQQIKDSITTAHVTIADITDVNPNVMWELGYADGLGKTIVILNQSPGSSPFDMVDRRQVAYHLPPTQADEDNVLRHLQEALRRAIS